MIWKIACVMMCLLGVIQSLHAQEDELQPVDEASVDINAILGGKDKGISKVRVIADSEQSLSVEVSFKGLDQKSKISGAVLNKMKKPLKEVVTEPKILSSEDGTVELKFHFKQGTGGYNKSFIESQFLSLSVSKSDGLLENLDLGGENIMGDNYLYKLEKKWRVSGSEQMVIEVKMTPFKSAASISP
jgi:hypothetical protein